MSSNEPVKNGCDVIYEMFHILNCGFHVVSLDRCVWNWMYLFCFLVSVV